MKNLIYILLVLLLCNCNNVNHNRKEGQTPIITHIQDTYYSKYYLFEGFCDDEFSIKHLFSFAKSTDGDKWFVTDKKGVFFEDNHAVLDTSFQRFTIENDSNKIIYAKVNFKQSQKINFGKEKEENTTVLSSDFDSLNLNIVQNMLDFAKADSGKFISDNYTYELYNKDGIKKIVIEYHEQGKWFEIEIL